MTATKTRLYKSLKPCVRKEDHAELARMLQMVMDSGDKCWFSDQTSITTAFSWSETPQCFSYWHALSHRLKRAGSGDVA